MPSMLSTSFIVAGAGLFLALGLAHLAITFSDLRAPRRFAPADAAVLDAMRATTVRMAPKGHDFWRTLMGFHFSHSLGVLVYAGGVIAVTLFEPSILASGWVRALFASIAIGYCLLAHSFWFSRPLIGASIGTALMLIGFGLHS